MTKNERQHDYFNTKLIELINQTEGNISKVAMHPDIHDMLRDLQNDLRKEFGNAQAIK